MQVTAVVPLKALAQAKRRLAADLDVADRLQLVAWMFARVVDACRRSRHLDRLLVVAGDDTAAALARAHGVQWVLVEPTPGLAAAMAAGDRVAADAAATLVVAADLPLITPGELDAVCRAGQDGPCVVVATTDDGGTGALLRRPPAVVATAFGGRSAAAHLRLAGDAGVRAVRLRLPGLALDIDTPGQLRAAGLRRHGGDVAGSWGLRSR